MFSRSLQSLLLVMAVSIATLAQAQTAANRQEQATKTRIIIDRQLVRFTAQGGAVEWRLVVSNQQGEVKQFAEDVVGRHESGILERGASRERKLMPQPTLTLDTTMDKSR